MGGRSRAVLTPLLILLAIKSHIVSAQASATGTLRLNDAERADLLSHNTETSVDNARAGLGGDSGSGRQIHGEAGAAIGSNGLRSAYGAATIPLGSDAAASVYFENSHYGTRR